MLSLPMLWLKKLNFMETAKLEMELMKSLDAGEDLEAKLAAQKQLAESSGDAEQAWKAEVWDKMLVRIRKMESMLNSSDQP
jgi:hypothetical protein